MRTALLLGGPKDGEVMAVRDDQYGITVALFDNPIRWDSTGPFLEGDDPIAPVGYRAVDYSRRTLVLFGQRLHVWTDRDFTESALDVAASRHLLSPLAHKLIEEGS